MRKRTFTEETFTENGRISFTDSDRVVSVRVKNQGTAQVNTGWNESVPNEIAGSGGSDSFDAGDSGIITGDLKITFAAAGTKNAVILKTIDIEEICD